MNVIKDVDVMKPNGYDFGVLFASIRSDLHIFRSIFGITISVWSSNPLYLLYFKLTHRKIPLFFTTNTL